MKKFRVSPKLDSRRVTASTNKEAHTVEEIGLSIASFAPVLADEMFDGLDLDELMTEDDFVDYLWDDAERNADEVGESNEEIEEWIDSVLSASCFR